jgi:hypothetical protein
VGRREVDASRPGQEAVAGPCEHGNETFGFYKRRGLS